MGKALSVVAVLSVGEMCLQEKFMNYEFCRISRSHSQEEEESSWLCEKKSRSWPVFVTRWWRGCFRMQMIFVSIIGSLCWSLFQQQCTMSRADEGAAFTCSWRDRLTGRETLWGNKGVPKTKEGHNQSQIPLRTSLPPIGAESPGVQVALSTNSVSVSRSLKLFWSVPILMATYGPLKLETSWQMHIACKERTFLGSKNPSVSSTEAPKCTESCLSRAVLCAIRTHYLLVILSGTAM